jgi:multidrug resistance efflux pump
LTGRQETLFGRTVTPQERLRQHQRALTKAQRELDRERGKLEQSEKKLIIDIRKSAKSGQMVRLLALLLYGIVANFGMLRTLAK